MADALEVHDSIVTSEIARAGGRVLKTTGDGMLAVFDTPVDAVAASIAVQRRTIAVTEALGLEMVRLQASTRLVMWRRRQGLAPDGSEELAALFASFQSGHDEPDLLAAAHLLS